MVTFGLLEWTSKIGASFHDKPCLSQGVNFFQMLMIYWRVPLTLVIGLRSAKNLASWWASSIKLSTFFALGISCQSDFCICQNECHLEFVSPFQELHTSFEVQSMNINKIFYEQRYIFKTFRLVSWTSGDFQEVSPSWIWSMYPVLSCIANSNHLRF